MAANKRIYPGILFCLLLLTPILSSATTPIPSIVIFGDSLSDTGNTTHLLKSLRQEEDPAFLVTPFRQFVLNKMFDFANDYYVPKVVLDTGIAVVTDFFNHEVAFYMTNLIARVKLVPTLPGEPYWNNRFSNGRVWNEYLAVMLNIKQGDEQIYTNKAFGGSWTATYDYQLTVWNLIKHPVAAIKNLIVGKLIPPSLGLTVQAYLLEHSKLNSDSVYFIFSGANDYLNILEFEDNYEQAKMSKYIDNVLDGLTPAVYKLIHAGAKKFVVIGLPYLGETPRFVASKDRDLLNLVIDTHNTRLKHRIEDWKILYPETDFLYIDLQKYFTQAVNTPEEYGFTNVNEACINVTFPMFSALRNSPFAGNYVLQYAQVLNYRDKRLAYGQKNYNQCTTPNSYLFWDEVHPSARAHKYLAYEICKSMVAHGYEANCVSPK